MSFFCGCGGDPCTIVTLQGLELWSSGRVDGTNMGLMSPVDGWANGTDSDTTTGGWEDADGGPVPDIRWAPRTLTIDGDILARSHADLAEAMEEVGQVLTRPRRDLLVVDESVHLGLVRQIEVHRTRRPIITQVSPTYAVFTLMVEAPEWERVGVDAQSATVTTGGVACQNIGTADAAVTATLTGPLTNPGLSWAGGTWQYEGVIPAGRTLTVDMRRRRVRDLATAVHYRQNAAGSWLNLPPGTTTVTRTGTGSGSIRLDWRSTWA